MYPDFQYLFQKLFGLNIEGLSIVKTFGFFVAMAFIAAAWVLAKELKRKKEEGLFLPQTIETVIGKPATVNEILFSSLFGFLMGYKLVGLFTNASTVSADPVAYLFSAQGNILAGLLLGALMGYLRYAEKKKKQLPSPRTEKQLLYPHDRVADIVFIAAGAGFAGAKIFNVFESWNTFIADPIGSLFSGAGLTFYGGLILATICLYLYAKVKKFSFAHLCDAAAPALILAYGLGRLGCQFSGDGDWGVYNSAYVTEATTIEGRYIASNQAPLKKVNLVTYEEVVKTIPNVFIDRNENTAVPNIYAPAPSFLPNWLFAQNFKNNVNNDGIAIAEDNGYYNHVLPAGVFPTSMYEAGVCVLIFLFLWTIRRKLKRPLQMFGIYLIFNGLERFFIEKIRVNYKYDWGFIHPTQAEIISFALVLTGLYLLFFYRPKKIAKLISG